MKFKYPKCNALYQGHIDLEGTPCPFCGCSLEEVSSRTKGKGKPLFAKDELDQGLVKLGKTLGPLLEEGSETSIKLAISKLEKGQSQVNDSSKTLLSFILSKGLVAGLSKLYQCPKPGRILRLLFLGSLSQNQPMLPLKSNMIASTYSFCLGLGFLKEGKVGEVEALPFPSPLEDGYEYAIENMIYKLLLRKLSARDFDVLFSSFMTMSQSERRNLVSFMDYVGYFLREEDVIFPLYHETLERFAFASAQRDTVSA